MVVSSLAALAESLPAPPDPDLHPAPAEAISAEEAARLFAAVADPTRMIILRTLTRGTTGVFDLQARLPIAPNLLSYHLKVLRDAKLIVSVRRGRSMDYSLVQGALARLHAAVPAP